MKMRLSYHKVQQVAALAILSLVISGFYGCGQIGPRSISMGRADYNEAINKTENEQMLMSIIIGRYGETFSLLSVSGVAANIRFAANAGAQVGIGPTENYLGNLVPLSGALVYEENPTITYSPVQGEQYFRQLMSPIPVDILVLFVRSGMASARVLILLANRINDMQNPDFLKTPAKGPDIRFERFAELNAELYQEGVLQWVEHPREDVPFAILISGYSPQYLEKVSEYLGLLGVPMPTDVSKDIVLPVYFGAKGRNADGVAVSTRSTVDLIQLLRAAIEVPQEHADKALTLNYPKAGLAGQGIRIHASKEKPDNAAVAVMYRGYWFYVAEDDARTKSFYMMVRTLWSVSIAAGADQRAAPVLTIPVSR
jgi:hypothetical protein